MTIGPNAALLCVETYPPAERLNYLHRLEWFFRGEAVVTLFGLLRLALSGS